MLYPEKRYGKGMLNFSERTQHYLCCGKIWTGQVCCWKNGKVKDCVIVQIVRGIVRRNTHGQGNFRSLVQVSSSQGPIFYEALLTAQCLPELHLFRGSTSSPEQVNMKAGNWGMQIDWWLQPRAVFRQTFSGIIWHMGQKKVNSTWFCRGFERTAGR